MKEEIEQIRQRHTEWEGWDFSQLLMLYRDISGRWAISMFKNEDNLHEIQIDLDFVASLLNHKFHDKKERFY